MMGWFGWERISRERRRLVQLSEIIGEPSDSFLSSPKKIEQEKGGSFALQAEKKTADAPGENAPTVLACHFVSIRTSDQYIVFWQNEQIAEGQPALR
jgi:hypothetical protein